MKRSLRLVILATTIALLGFLGVNAPSAVSAQGAAPRLEPNVPATYLGPDVVISGQALATGGIDTVSIVVQDTATGLYVQDANGSLGAASTSLDAWAGLMPPPGDPGVSWRVPLSLGNGTYETTINATSGGTQTTSAPISFDVVDVETPSLELIPVDATWSYYDAGDLPAADWFSTTFDDSTWATGPAELGYGDGDEATVTNAQTDAEETVLTQYFRHTFNAGDLSEYGSIELLMFRDDGAAIYLNGAEFGRTNLPNGPLTAETLASSSSEQLVGATFLPEELLPGDNVIAVEVHQVDPSSSDLSFYLSLAAAPVTQPRVSDNTEGTYVLTAGDMANCSFEGDEAVAGQMAELWDTDAGVFLGLGDLAYGSGTLSEFQNCFDPSIGQFKDVIWPSAGNHEHYTVPNAAGYRAYFGEAAGPFAGPAGGLWYSFDLDDDWMVIALDSDCRGREILPGAIDGDGCAPGSEQELWLRSTLADNLDKNVIAFFHHPPYTNNHYTDHEYTWPLWRALSEYGADITLHGHEHHYERYAELDYWGDHDPGSGIREFIIGSGGTFPRYETRPQKPESDFKGVFPQGTFDFGVLQLWLRPDGYEWKWDSINGLAESDAGVSGLNDPMPVAALDGTVTELETGAPLGGVQVCATAQRTAVEVCTTTAADGTYALAERVTDAYVVTATAVGKAPVTIPGQAIAAPVGLTVDFDMAIHVGDVNCDGAKNVVDALIVAQYSATIRTLSQACPLGDPATELWEPAGDFNTDAAINIVDALLMAQCAAEVVNDYC